MPRVRKKAVGQQVPPLATSIKRQLDQYFDGQILKELLQNAEDAGARELRLIIDRREFGTDSLLEGINPKCREEFKVCQGPALLAWNDAVFSERDWESIQKPMRSEKENDPDSIGRFGLGFLSVYHLTDFPWIVSGNRIMVLDPRKTGICHAQIDGRTEIMSGLDFFLDNPEDVEEIARLKHQFEPFQHLDLTGPIGGTLFRFPLRTNPSIISSTIYSVATSPAQDTLSMESLFEAFTAGQEGENLLLFLSSVRKVSLWIHNPDEEKPRQIYRVRSDKVETITRIAVKTEEGNEQNHKWMIEHEFYELVGDKRKRRKSKIGVAAESPQTRDISLGSGYTYCFLPIPFVEANQTGMPFHIHGDFLLNDNRRNVIWPTADNQHNSGANANLEYTQEIVPGVILQLMEKIRTSPGSNVESNNWIASLWPDIDSIRNPAWQKAAENLYHDLDEQEIFWSPFSKKWLPVGKIIFLIEMGEIYRPAVEKFLQLAKIPAVPYINTTFSENFTMVKGEEVKALCPSVLAKLLRSHFNAIKGQMDGKERKTLLQYLTSDPAINIFDLAGLKLLPLMNGDFDTFSLPSPKTQTIFAMTNEIPFHLFPGLSGRILDVSFNDALKAVIDSARSQLRFVTTGDIPNLVKDVLEKNVHLPHYFEKLWKYLQGACRRIPLNKMEGLSILPLRNGSSCETLGEFRYRPKDNTICLKKNFRYLSAKDLDEETCQNLEQDFGLPIIAAEEYLFHPDLHTFVIDGSSGVNLVQVLSDLFKVNKSDPEEMVLDESVPFLLSKFSTILPSYLSPNHRNLIASLKIFPSYEEEDILISAKDANYRTLSHSWADKLAGFNFLNPIAVLRSDHNNSQQINSSELIVASLIGMTSLRIDGVVRELSVELSHDSDFQSSIIRRIFSWDRKELETTLTSLMTIDPSAIANEYLSLIEDERVQLSQCVENITWFLGKHVPGQWPNEMSLEKCIPCVNNCLHTRDTIIKNTVITTCPHLCLPKPELHEAFLRRLGIPDFFSPLVDGPWLLRSLHESYGSLPLDPETIDVVLMALRKISDSISSHHNVDFDLFLPDKDSIMRHLDELVYMFTGGGDHTHFEAHNALPPDMVKKFGMAVERDIMLKAFESDDDEDWGEEFGQEIDLANRIKRLIEQYHAPNDFIQEFAQNAEDAGARKLVFIIDARQHQKEKLLHEDMASLQGPALLVYNSSTFTKQDFAGIQKLGIGSKGDDREKIGRFGAGFNCAYGYTDCPIFLSDNQHLCILDPLRKHLAFNKAKRPGKKFTIDHRFPSNFGGTYDTFILPQLAENMPLEGGTLFRLPLRMKKSALWDEIITPRMVGKMLHSAKTDVMRMLLFLNHVEEVSAYCITPSGELHSYWEVKAVDRLPISGISSADFSAKVHNAAVMRTPPEDVPLAQCSYELTLQAENATGTMTESWLISNRLGFNLSESEKKSKDASNQSEMSDPPRLFSGKIKLLPIGGVAKLLTPPSHKESQKIATDLLFVSLPLPARTGLPVTLHGHFCLDSEGRKNFWTSCHGQTDERKKWNEAVLNQIVGPAYADLLQALTQLEQMTEENLASRENLKLFWKTFPDPRSATSEDWKSFAKGVYDCVLQQNVKAIPCRNENAIVWRALSDDYQEELPIFYQPTEAVKKIEAILIAMGMRLVHEAPFYVTNEFLRTEKVVALSPENVSKLFRNIPITSPQVTLPCSIEVTKFYQCYGSYESSRKEKMQLSCRIVADVLMYILSGFKLGENEEDGGNVSIAGLPLLITQDLNIGFFCDVFIPYSMEIGNISDLFPTSSNQFAHPVLERIWMQKSKLEEEYFLHPKVEDINRFLQQLLPEQFREYHIFVPFDELSEYTRPGWLTQFWNIVFRIIRPKERTKLGGKDALQALESLQQWNLIPVSSREAVTTYLISIEMRNVVLSSSLKFNLAYLPFGLPFVKSGTDHFSRVTIEDFYIFDTIFVHEHNEFGKAINFWKAKKTLKWESEANTNSRKRERSRIAGSVREYFEKAAFNHSSYLEDLKSYCKYGNRREPEKIEWSGRLNYILKSLPIFNTIAGKLVAIDQAKTYVKPDISYVKPNGMECFDNGEIIFLKQGHGCHHLYEKLEIEELSDMELIMKLVIPSLPRMQVKDQAVQLKSIKDDYIRHSEVMQELETCNFVRGERVISDFCSDKCQVFRVMLPKSAFLPDDFVDALNNVMPRSEWSVFFKKLGYRTTPSLDDLVNFATEISHSGKVTRVIELKAKSVLAGFLLLFSKLKTKEKPMVRNAVLTIEFLPSGEIEDSAMNMFPGKMKKSKLTSLSASFPFSERLLVWSTSSFLPEWAEDAYNMLVSTSKKDILPVAVKHSSGLLQFQAALKVNQPKHEGVNSKESIQALNEYLNLLYIELNKHINRLDEFKEELSRIPMIAVEQGTCLIAPNMVVKKLENEIPPFLYRRPEELKKFKDVFNVIGVKKNPETYHFTKSLELFFKTRKDGMKNPNVLKAIQHAQADLLQLENFHWDNVESLYLLTTENTLCESSRLIFMDNDQNNTKSIKQIENFFVWASPSQLSLDKKTIFIDSMPATLKPKIFSHVTTNAINLEESKVCIDEMCQVKEKWERVLSSPELFEAVKRIYYSEKRKLDKPEIWNEAEKLLKDVAITCYSEIIVTTSLKESSDILKKSSKWFHSNPIVNGAHSFFLCHEIAIRHRGMIATDVAKRLIELLPLNKCKEKNTLLIFPYLLTTDPEKMAETLDQSDLPELPFNDANCSDEFTLGAILPPELVKLVKQHPALFFLDGEYVGYQKDCSEDGLELILAQIVKCIASETSALGAKYLIKCAEEDEELVEASNLDLYKFCDEARDFYSQLVPVGSPRTVSPDEESSNDYTSLDQLQEAKDKVTEYLENAWKLGEEEKKKAFRRIMLTWHPDKNPGRVELATEVFKHLQAEIERLKKGLPRQGASFSTSPSRNDSYDYDEDFNRYQRQWNNFESRPRSGPSRGARSNPRSSRKRPNPDLGRAYWKQSMHDFNAARSTSYNSNGKEVVIFLARRAVESGLKAMVLIKTGSHENTHSLHELAKHIAPFFPRNEMDNLITDFISESDPDYILLQYPNVRNNEIPHNRYSAQQETNALQNAEKILRAIARSTIFDLFP